MVWTMCVNVILKRIPAVQADILKQEIGAVFEQVLLDAGVFKRTSEGLGGFNRFIEYLNLDSI